MFNSILGACTSFIEKVREFNESIYPNPHESRDVEERVDNVVSEVLKETPTSSAQPTQTMNAVIHIEAESSNTIEASLGATEEQSVEIESQRTNTLTPVKIRASLASLEEKGITYGQLEKLDETVLEGILQNPNRLTSWLDRHKGATLGHFAAQEKELALRISSDKNKWSKEESTNKCEILRVILKHSGISAKVDHLKALPDYVIREILDEPKALVGLLKAGVTLDDLEEYSPRVLKEILEKPHRLVALIEAGTNWRVLSTHYTEEGQLRMLSDYKRTVSMQQRSDREKGVDGAQKPRSIFERIQKIFSRKATSSVSKQ